MTITRFDPTEAPRALLAGPTASTPTEAHPSPIARPLTYDSYRVGDELGFDFDVPGVDPAAIHLSLEDRVVVAMTRELVTAKAMSSSGVQRMVLEQWLLLPHRPRRHSWRWIAPSVVAEMKAGAVTVNPLGIASSFLVILEKDRTIGGLRMSS